MSLTNVLFVSLMLLGTACQTASQHPDAEDWGWMQSDSRRLKEWLTSQNTRTEEHLNRDDREQRIRKFEAVLAETGSTGAIETNRMGIYVHKKKTGSNHSSILYKANDGSTGTVLDSEKIPGFGGNDQISYFNPSPSGRFIAFGVTPDGSEVSTLKVFDVKAGIVLPGSTNQTQYASIEFLPDETGFLYVRHDNLLNSDKSKVFEDNKVRLHRFSEEFSKDVVVADGKAPADKPIGPFNFYTVRFLPGANTVVLATGRGTTAPWRFYYKSIPDFNRKDKPWQSLAAGHQNIKNFTMSNDALYFIDYLNGEAELHRISFASGKPVEKLIPFDAGLELNDVNVAKDGLYLDGRDGIRSKTLVLSLEGKKLDEFTDPLESATDRKVFNKERAGFVIQKSTINRAREFFEYKASSRSFQPLGIEPAKQKSRDLVLTEHWATSKDGTKVPLLIVAARSTTLSAKTPILVTSYATYGFIGTPHFDRMGLEWYEAGAAKGYCLARGGGELGEKWHREAQRALKYRSIEDNIACAEYLIKNSLSSAPKMAFIAASAGGIIAGNLITQRPDLYKAVIANVGVLNMSLFAATEGGQANIPEFGDPAVPEEAAALRALDAYLNIKDGVRYPAVLANHGFNDIRVPIWMSAKFIGRLQAGHVGQGPILIKTNFSSGHGVIASLRQQAEDWADNYSFLYTQLQMQGSQ